MSNKSKLASIAEAGVNIIAKLKNKTREVIIPQDITYTETFDTEDSNVRNIVKNMKKDEDKNFEITEETAEAFDKDAENAFSQFQSIASKIENIKKSLLEVITNSENKRNELLKSGLKKEDLQKELDKTVSDIDEKLNIIKEMMDKTSDILVAFDSATQNNYSVLSKDLKSVSENAEKTGQKLETLEGTLNEAKQKVGEIHQTTASIDKLYDSVFELKTANIENKTAIETLNANGKKRFAVMTTGIYTFGAVSIASLVISILVLVLK